MSDRTARIEQALQTASTTLANLRTERDDCLLGLANAPEDATLAATLDQLRVEIPQAEGRLAELESVLERARKDDTIDARQAKRDKLQALRDEAVQLATARVAIAEKIDNTLAAFGDLLDQWAEAGTSINAAAAEMVKGACPDIGERLTISGDLLRLADGTAQGFAAVLAARLHAAGLFERGIIHGDNSVALMGKGVKATLAEFTEVAAQRMDRLFTRFDAKADEQLLAKPRAMRNWAAEEVMRSQRNARRESSAGAHAESPATFSELNAHETAEAKTPKGRRARGYGA